MKSFFEKVSQFFYTKQNSPAWRVLALLMAGCVVFTTTYSMVLPAITIDQSTAEEMPGIFVEDIEEPEGYYEEAAVEEEAAPSEEVTEEQTEPENDPAAGTDLGSEDAADEQNEEAEAAYTEPEYTDEEDEAVYTDGETDDAAVYADGQDAVTDEQTAEEQAVTESEEAPVIEHQLASELTYEGGDYTVTASFDTPIEYRDALELTATEMAAPDYEREYNAYYDETVARMLEREIDGIVDARYFRFKVNADGQDIAPAGGVTFTLTYQNSTEYLYGETPYAIGFRAGDERQQDLYNAEALSMQDGDSYFAYGYTFRVDGWDYSTVGAFRSAAPAEAEESTEEVPAETETAVSEEEVVEEIDAVASEEEVVEETTLENIDATSAAESVAEPVVEEEKFEGRLRFAGDGYKVIADITQEAGLPLETELKVDEILPGNAQYDELLAQAAAATAEDKNVAFARFFDISFMADGEEKEPTAGVSVRIEYSSPEKEEIKEATGVEVTAAPEASDVSVMHFGEDGLNEVESNAVEKRGKTTVEFESDSFSVYGIVYTVDFETVDGGTYSIPGEGSYKLNNLLPYIIGKEGKVSDATLELVEGEEVEGALYLTQDEEKDWYINSDVAFTSTYELTMVVDGVKYVVKVTDEASETNLNNLIGNVSIDNVQTNTENNGTVIEGREYNIHLTFAETKGDPTKQFSTNQSLTYTLPEGIDISALEGTFSISYGGRSYGGNTYTYDPATRQFTIEFSRTVASLVERADDTTFTIDIKGSFNGERNSFDFGNGQNKTLTVDDTHDTKVTKTGYYNSNDNKIHYTVTASSTGKSDNVVITDNVTGTALSYDRGSYSINGNSSTPLVSESGNGFVMTFPSMADNETITINYTASVNFNNLTGKGTVEQTGNTVKIKSKDEPEEEVPFNVNNQIDYNPLHKSAGEATGDGMVKTLPWTITINENQLKSMAGSKVTDTIGQNSRDIMKYSGNGITVKVMDGNTVIRTITQSWADLGIDPQSATSWSYTLPNTSDDRNNTYKYVISYTSDVDTTGKVADFNVDNTVHDDEGHNTSGSGTVPPGGESVSLKKKNTATSASSSTWEVSFNVPSNGLTKAIVTENLPTKWIGSTLVVDELMGEIGVVGLTDTESYDIDTSTMSTDGTVTITFYKSGEKTEENQGLVGTGSERTIKLTFITENTEEWVVNYPGDAHTNNVSLNANGQVVTAHDSSYPQNEGVAKTGFSAGTIEVNGKNLPIFHYTLSIYGVTEESFQNADGTAKNLVVTDKYDPTYLELYEGYDNDRVWHQQYNGGVYNARDYITVTDDNTKGEIKIEAQEAEFEKDGNGAYLSVYHLDYYLIVKEEKLSTLQTNSLQESVKFKNEVYWDNFHDDVTIEYEYPVVDKEVLSVDTDSRTANYRIVLNPDKLPLNGEEPMTMTDSATNLSIDYSTLKITADPDAEIPYYYRGNTGYFTIPDSTKVEITYSARIIGDGEITFSNEAVMNGHRDSTKETRTITSSGSGNLTINWVLLYKHEYQKMNKPLDGAVYVMTDSEGNPILYPSSADNGKAGEPITFKTETRDLHHLPDGLWVMDSGEIVDDATKADRIRNGDTYTPDQKSGYAWLFLDMSRDGMALATGVTYYFKEYEAPDNYQKSDGIYSFTIAEHPDYNDYEYYKGDILRFADTPVEGVLELQKEFEGASNLTDNQKKQITFLITGVDSEGNAIKIPYGGDGNNLVAPESGLEISYADFENGKYSLNKLPEGTYTVKETNQTLSGYNWIGTTYKVDDVEVSDDDNYSATVVIDSDQRKHSVSYTNKYENTGANITLIKKDETNTVYLYGATFQLKKKNGSEYIPVSGAGLDENGKFTIDYENRTTGVTLTGLEDGEYQIIEVEAPRNYYKDETPFYFTVSNGAVSNGTGTAHVTFSNENNNPLFTVKNDLEHSYTLSKVDAFHLSKKLNGAVFTVYKLNSVEQSDGKVSYTFDDTEIATLTTDNDGKIYIDARKLNLQEGVMYSVKETVPPAGYSLNDKVYNFFYGTTTPNVSTSLNALGESVVNLTNGPIEGYVPDEEDSMDLYVRKQWYKVDGSIYGDRDLTGKITEIEVKLHQVIKDTEGNLISDNCYPDNDTTYTLTVGGAGNQSFIEYKFEDLPTGKSDNIGIPQIYSYYVEEVVPEGYEARYKLDVTRSGNFKTDETVLDNADDAQVNVSSEKKEIQILNSPKPKHLKVTKVWLDEGNHADNIKPIVELWYRDATGEHKVTTTAEIGGAKINPTLPDDSTSTPKDYTYEWTSLTPFSDDGSEREYFVVEESGKIAEYKGKGYKDPEYSVDDDGNSVITNIKTDSDKLKVKKVWLDSDGTELQNPPDTPVTVQLQKKEGIAGEGYTINVTIQNGYGNEPSKFAYKVRPSGNFSIYIQNGGSFDADASNTDGASFDSGTLSLNSVERNHDIYLKFGAWFSAPSQVNIDEPLITWSEELSDVTTSDGIKMNGAPITADQTRVTLDSNNNWMHTWENLTAPDDKVYAYSVREVEVPAGFDVSYENNDGITTGIMYVKNVKSQYTRAFAHKKWLNANGEEIAAPENAEVTFAIYQDGRRMAKTVTLNGTVDAEAGETGETEPWVATWEGLEYYKADGTTAHEYTILESTGFTGYTSMVYNPDSNEYVVMESDDTIASGGTIYNKKVRSIEVVKVWRDKDGQEYETLPEGLSVTINLYKDGGTTLERSITLDGRKDVNGEQSPWKATFDNLEDNATYTIDESDLPNNYKLVDPALTPITADSGDSTIRLINREEEPKNGSLSITKEIKDGSPDASGKTFTFEVELNNSDETPYSGKVKVEDSTRTTATEATVTDGKITVTVSGTGTATISEIPAGTTYEVTEPKRNPDDGWSQDGAVEYNDTTKTIAANDTDTAKVTNKYEATGSVTFEGTKTIENRNFKEGDTLSVSINSSDGGKLPDPANKSVTLTTNGTSNTADFSFDEVTYTYDDIKDSTETTKSKTFHYTVTEAASMAGTIADTRTHTIEVTVTDKGNGELQVDKVYKADSKNEDKTAFVNTYDTSCPVEITATKSMKGGETPGTFKYTLTSTDPMPDNEEGTARVTSPFEKAVSGAAVSFGRINYTLDDMANATSVSGSETKTEKTFTYTVSEVDESTTNTNIKYDPAEYTVTVKLVYDRSNGTLSLDTDYPKFSKRATATSEAVNATDITFQNEEVKEVTVEKEWKNANGNTPPANAEITLSLYKSTDTENALSSVKLNGKIDVETVTNSSAQETFQTAGNDSTHYEFEAWKAKWTDLPKYEDGKVITYVIKETVPQSGYTVSYNNGSHQYAAESGKVTNTEDEVSLSGTKTWIDSKSAGAEGAADHPDVTIKLFTVTGTAPEETETPVQTQSTDSSKNYYLSWNKTTDTNKWTYSITHLPKTDSDGKQIKYRVREELPETSRNKYKADVEYSDGKVDGTTGNITEADFTNTELTKVSVTKKWSLDGSEVNDSDDNIESITVQLFRKNGGAVEIDRRTGKPLEAGATATPYTIYRTRKSGSTTEYEWKTLEINNLDKYYMDGTTQKEYEYYFVETAVNGYTTLYRAGNADPVKVGSRAAVKGDGEVIITNAKYSVSLPSTGGVGTTPYTTAGGLLLASTALAYIFKRRRFALAMWDDDSDSQWPGERK